MPDDKIWIAFIVTGVYAFLNWNSFVDNVKLILFIALVLSTFSVSIYLLFGESSFVTVGLNLGRFVSLVIISILFFYRINILSFVASLKFFLVPTPIAISFGVGFRFIPIISQEIKRIAFVQKQNDLGFSFNSIRENGFLKIVDRFFSPLLLSILRKVESVSVSIAVQQIQERVGKYVFTKPAPLDLVLVASSIVLLLVSFRVI
jgi:hypothetical protein